jgi:AcrR family transcriptional regulator
MAAGLNARVLASAMGIPATTTGIESGTTTPHPWSSTKLGCVTLEMHVGLACAPPGTGAGRTEQTDDIDVPVGTTKRMTDATRARTKDTAPTRAPGERGRVFWTPDVSSTMSFPSYLSVSYIRMNDRGKRKRPLSPRGAGRPRPADPPGTSERLLEGTIATLRERGLGGTTSREIAGASGVNLAGITYHFGSKDGLVAQALLRTVRGWLEPALAILRQDLHPAVRMIGAVQALQQSFERARDLLPVYVEALVQAPRGDALRTGVEELFAELRGFLAGQIAELKRMDFLPAWIEPDAMAMLLVATGDGLALHTAIEPNAVDHHAVAGQAMQLLLSASDAMKGFAS